MKNEKGTLKVLKNVCLSVIAVFSLMTFVACGGGGDDPAPAPAINADLTGTWDVYTSNTDSPGTDGPDVWTFSQSGANITCSATLPDAGLVSGSGTMTGSSFALTIKGNDNGHLFTINARGTVSGDSFSGTWSDSDGQSGTWWGDKDNGTNPSGSAYNVYGGQVSISGELGYDPEQYGYVAIGTSTVTKTFSYSFNYYIIGSPNGSTIDIDSVRGSNGNYYGTSITGNTLNAANISGPPDDKVATIGYQDSSGVLSGYIVIDAAGDFLGGITVFR